MKPFETKYKAKSIQILKETESTFAQSSLSSYFDLQELHISCAFSFQLPKLN